MRLVACVLLQAFVCLVRPKFGSQLEIEAASHPLLIDRAKEVIPNDTVSLIAKQRLRSLLHLKIVAENTRFVLITGPNMVRTLQISDKLDAGLQAGKSTYIKGICLLQILAQMGCYVPAKSAVVAPRKHIFCRVGHNDDLGDNLSSFGVEVRLQLLACVRRE